jgi:hypothetical protein
MLFISLYGLVQIAQDENEANDQIQKINQVLLCDNYDSFVGSYNIAGIFEADEVEDFGNALQENLTQFAKEYKEKIKNV